MLTNDSPLAGAEARTDAGTGDASHRPAPPLRIAVMGAGAVGGYYGALLAAAGHHVTLIGRQALVQAVQARGLRLQTAQSDRWVPLQASTAAAAAASAEVVLLAVKAGDTESAGRALRPHLQPGTLLVCLQNGVDNAQRLRAVLPGLAVAVVAAAVYVAVAAPEPGHVRHHGRGELLLQRTDATAALAPVLMAAGIPCTLSDTVDSALWAKLAVNCVYNALSALGALPYGQLVQRPGVAQVMAEVLAECRSVAAAEGVALPPGLDAAVADIARTMAGQMSSTAQDLLRGRPSEIDHLNGYVVQRGEASGVAVPANRALWVAVKLAERARSANLAERAMPQSSTGDAAG